MHPTPTQAQREPSAWRGAVGSRQLGSISMGIRQAHSQHTDCSQMTTSFCRKNLQTLRQRRARRAGRATAAGRLRAFLGSARVRARGRAVFSTMAMKRILKFPNAIYKLVKPGKRLAPNEVLFHVPLWHNKVQIKNYLEEIYNVEVDKVHTNITLGKTRRFGMKYRVIHKKAPDVKKAYVTLRNQTFDFPDIAEE